jgi:class 3 adenylate cyclase
MPGARIVGGGFALFILLMLCVIIAVFIDGDVVINDSTLWGQLFMLALVLAILSIPISMSMYLAWRFAHVSHNLKAQLTQVEALSARTREQEAEKQRLLESRREELEREVAERTASLRLEKQKSEDLLLNILPAEVAEELKEKGHADAKLYNNVTVLFTDFVDFTQRSERLKPAELVALIDHYFKAFDTVIEAHGLEKIKTIGDAYLAVCGLPAEHPEHAKAVVAAALEIRDFMLAQQEKNPAAFQIRIGINSGPVVAGIVGVKKFAYDIWGDTVNTAARMEQHGEPGKVNISTATYELVKDAFRCSFRGELEAKHKGKMGMYFAER